MEERVCVKNEGENMFALFPRERSLLLNMPSGESY